jgi:PAS domain S-box-containing protein
MQYSMTSATATEWHRMGGVFALFVVPFGILFLLSLSRWIKRLSHRMVFALLFLPAIFFLPLVIARLDTFTTLPSNSWYWKAVVHPNAVNNALYIWLSLSSLVMLALTWTYYFHARRDSFKKKSALLIASGLTVPVMGGIICEVLRPMLFHLDTIPVTTSLFTVFSFLAFLAIKRYRLLDYSPKHQWDRVLETMCEGILIVNDKGEVRYANRNFCDALGYTFEEIKGRVAHELFLESGEHKEKIKKAIAEGQVGVWGKYEVQLVTRTGEKIWVLMSNSPYRDRKGKIIGSIGIQMNIDEHKKAESAGRVKEERLQHAIDVGRMVAIDMDFRKSTISFSRNSLDVLGIDHLETNISESLNAAVVPEDRELVSGSFVKLQQGMVADVQFRILRPDSGRMVWLERRGEIVKNASGEAVGLRGLLIDITQHMLYEEKLNQNTRALLLLKLDLEKSERSLKRAQALAHLGSWESDFSTMDTTWSDEVFRIFETLPQEQETSHEAFFAFVHPEDRDRVKNIFEHSIETLEECSFECRVITRLGTLRHIFSDCRFEFGRDGAPKKMYGIIHDISERKKAEAALVHSEFRLKEAQAIAHLGSWELNFATGISVWSDEARRIYGFPLGRKFTFDTWTECIHPDDLDMVNAEIKRSQADMSPSVFDHRIIRPDGTVRYIHSESRFEFRNGKPVGLYGICLDITDRKKTEEKLITLNREMETFIYKISHDIRGPVSSIIGLTSVSKSDVTDKKALDYLEMVEKSARRLDVTLTSLMQSLRIKDAKEFDDPIDFTELLDSVCERLRFLDDYSRISITSRVSPSLTYRSNRSIMECIFQNLVENAIKYRSYTVDAPYLDIDIQREQEFIIMVFRDNGIGVAEELREKIFDMYFRGTEQSKGSGLGLYLVKAGVNKLGGKIEVSSAPGQGTVFTITLNANKV